MRLSKEKYIIITEIIELMFGFLILMILTTSVMLIIRAVI